MGTKLQPGKYDAYDKAAPDEPMFVLIARDETAPLLIEIWAMLKRQSGSSPEKVAEALDCARDMRRWSEERFRQDDIQENLFKREVGETFIGKTVSEVLRSRKLEKRDETPK